MTACVIDASVLISVVAEATHAADGRRRLVDERTCHAPHLIDAELGSVLRRMAGAGVFAPGEAAAAFSQADRKVDVRHAHRPLLEVAFSLRDNVTFYDALYVALAMRLAVPLLTGDRKLAHVPGLPCEVELV